MPLEATGSVESSEQGVSDILGVRRGLERGLADQWEAVTIVQEIEGGGWTQWAWPEEGQGRRKANRGGSRF